MYTTKTTLGELLENTHVVAEIEKLAPGFQSNPMLGMATGLPVATVAPMVGIGPEQLQELLDLANKL